ncbi:MAG: T9SS type A sorting domain-containing protein [Bacteroidales bacterium]|nr:T9SS type A sorting domain-containing protein [Bacteroidales bacterium]
MKKIFFITALIFSWAVVLIAQNDSLSQFQGKYHMLSPEELILKETYSNSKNFVSTPPPEGPVRSIAEYEPNQGVLVGRSQFYSFGIPVDFIQMLSQDVKVYVLVSNQGWNQTVTSQIQSAGANMDNIEIININIDSYWTRDYTPWYITYGTEPKIGAIDFPYNRPRPNDNNVPSQLAPYFNLELFGMNIEHTGGNYMCDGLGVAASTKLVPAENQNLSLAEIEQISYDYLGIENYMFIDDPLGEYIQHIDCWGKFLAVDKVLIGKVPENHAQYDEYEAVADYFANTNSSYGNKYKVYRSYSPTGEPYTNCLIMNDKVYVPFSSSNSEANIEVQNVFETAMPGYEIIGVPYSGWLTTDAMHCRTHEVPDLEMLYIGHIPYRNTVEIMDVYHFITEIIPYSGQEIIANSVKIHYKINGGEYQSENLNFTSNYKWEVYLDNLNSGDIVEYYLSASDASGRHETHPYIGAGDPHLFVIGENVSVNENIAESRYSIFPNPASERITLITDLSETAEIQYFIIDIYGRKLKQTNLDAKTGWQGTSIDISDLPQGIYYLKIINNKEEITKRFIVY